MQHSVTRHSRKLQNSNRPTAYTPTRQQSLTVTVTALYQQSQTSSGRRKYSLKYADIMKASKCTIRHNSSHYSAINTDNGTSQTYKYSNMYMYVTT